jgi:glucokinase
MRKDPYWFRPGFGHDVAFRVIELQNWFSLLFMQLLDSPRLLADIGSLYARFALETERGVFSHTAALRCADHNSLQDVVQAYLDAVRPLKVVHAALAMANPVDGDLVKMTNYPWQFSIETTRQALGLETLVVVNDFTALAMALPRLSANEVRQVGGGQPIKNSVLGLLGSGSGLGVSGLIPAGDSFISLGSEGGHTSFSPRDAREVAVLEYAWQHYDHVSFERLLSGPGLEMIHQALNPDARITPLAAPEISRRALEAADPACQTTLDVFCKMLGTAASNLAVTLGALGGIFIGGSIVPRLGEAFDRSGFRARFEDKGRFSGYAQNIFQNQPVRIAPSTGGGETEGTLVAAAVGAAFIGTFQGVEFTDSDGRRRVSNKWTASQVGTDVVAYATLDPTIVYEVQSDAALTVADIGKQYNLSAISGNTTTGLSSARSCTTSKASSCSAPWRPSTVA